MNRNEESVTSTEERTIKERKLEEARAEIETWVDGVGKGLDENIKETIVLCKVLDLPTSASCGGHFNDEDYREGYGTPFPWIEFQVEGIPQYRYIDEEKIYQDAAHKYQCSFEDVYRGRNNTAWIEVQEELEKQEETDAFKTWKIQQVGLEIELRNLLQEFYSDREATEVTRITLDPRSVACTLSNGGQFNIPNNRPERLHTELTDEERQLFPEMVQAGRLEWDAFRHFLKKKYFSET